MCVVNEKMCCNTTQVSSYHPNGMLDRDQRTTRIINSKLHRSVRYTNDECMKNQNSIQNCSQCSSSSFNVDLKKNCKYSTYSYSSVKECQISVLSNCKRSPKDLLESKRSRKESSTQFSSCKTTKLNSLLICICFWLLILQKTRALPIKMAEENNHHHEGSLKCSDVKGVIEKILQQSNVSYEINYNRLENYTQAVFSENHRNHHNMWRRKQFEWLYPNGEPLKFEDYDRQPPEEAMQHLRLPGAPTREELTHELTNLYQRLKILAMAFENIRKDQENHLHEIMDNKHPNHHIHIIEYFKQQYNYVKALLRETAGGMRQLGIEEPSAINQIPEYNGVRDLRDWIVTREHLKLLNYVLRAYEILSNRCI